MNKILEEILQSEKVVDEEGKEYPLHSYTPLEQGEFLQKLVKEIDAEVCLEVGLANGISSLFIAEAICGKDSPRFISIDPMQKDWHDIGLLNLQRAGYGKFVEFNREYSHAVLPRLLAKGERIDFAYVDTSKVFDVVLIDAYYLTRLLKIGGLLVFDDCSWPGVRRMARYIAKWPHLEVADRHFFYKRKFSVLRRLLSKAIHGVPKKEMIFTDSLITLDQKLRTDAHCIAFRKIAEDTRNWDWYRDF
jgi:predicted O-methyltransferase YrrM